MTLNTEPTDATWRQTGHGQRLIPHPVTGADMKYQRVSTFAKTLDSAGVLPQWTAWKVLVGAQDPQAADLVRSIVAAPKTPKKLVDELRDTYGGGREAAQRGTNRHKLLAAELTGLRVDYLPPEARAELDALHALLSGVGDVTGIEVPTVCDRWRVAGTCDFIFRQADGTSAVGDFKTGNSRHDGQWMTQVICHAAGQYWDYRTQTRTGPVAPVTRIFALWAPQDGRAPVIIDYDIAEAERMADLAADVRDARKRHG